MERARELLGMAQGAGLIRAMYLQSRIESKFSSAQRREQARLLLTDAAQAGDVLAQNTLGTELEKEGNIMQASHWYRLAASGGSQAAGMNINRLANKDRFAQRTEINALRAKGSAQSLYELALRYHKGEGVAANFSEAIRLYRKAADLGSLQAKSILALIMSKPGQKGEQVNAEWMQSLAQDLVRSDAEKASVQNGPPVLDEDPLLGLLTMPKGQLK